MRRAARYLRVSRSEQSIDLQADETAEFIERRGWELSHTFRDDGITGASDRTRRPGLDKLMRAAHRKEFDVLVVWRSDRLFRSLRHMIETLEYFRTVKIDFVSVMEPFDQTTPQGQLLLHLVAAFAQFERQLAVERIHSGIEAAKKRGRVGGRPRCNVSQARVLELRQEGKSVAQIAKQLGVSVATVKRRLQDNEEQAGSKTPSANG